ncbi:MAG: DUF3536 domain-containing protein, partial [Candidatus Adiutrix sp.]
VFFYDGAVSLSIAFEKLLSDGQQLLSRIEGAFGEPKGENLSRLVNLATDGESYGHHFPFGDMALSWLFKHLEKSQDEPNGIKLTNYGEYLAKFPPRMEARIYDGSSWSCAHGVERWRSDCGCNTHGGGGSWNQKWRAPLRAGFDWLGAELAKCYEAQVGPLLKDPWLSRDEYIAVIQSAYNPQVQEDFLKRHQLKSELTGEEKTKILSLLEAQLMGLYMFTSCAWFFDEISGLEPVQNLRYALRAIELTENYQTCDLRAGFLRFLAEIVPNVPKYKSGLDVWQKKVVPDSLTIHNLVAHWAAAGIFDDYSILDFFKVPEFKTKKTTRLSGPGIEIFGGEVEVFDKRTQKYQSECCLAVYSGGTHLAILVGQLKGPHGQSSDCLEHDNLLAALGPELSHLATLNIWDSMVKLMPLGTRFVLDDLLPFCRASLLTNLVSGAYEDIKRYTGEVFSLHQHLFMVHHNSEHPMGAMEQFVFRVMGEDALKRIFALAKEGKPINVNALAALLREQGLMGLAKKEPFVAEMAAEYFSHVLVDLPKAPMPRRLLSEILTVLTLTRDESSIEILWV